MPTNTEKIDDLLKAVAVLSTRMDAVQGELKRLQEEAASTRDGMAKQDSRLAVVEPRVPLPEELNGIRSQLAVLDSQLQDVRKSGDVWGNRLWTLAVAIAAGVLGYFLKR